MKKLLILLLASSLLTACGSEETAIPKEEKTTKEESNSEPTQEELNEKLKAEAVQADFVELNDPGAEMDKKVFAIGEVSSIKEDGIFQVFTLTTEDGMYSVTDVLKETEYTDGDTVKVYGTYKGKDDLGMPSINSTVIEKQ